MDHCKWGRINCSVKDVVVGQVESFVNLDATHNEIDEISKNKSVAKITKFPLPGTIKVMTQYLFPYVFLLH